MDTRGLPELYTLSPRACGPRALSVYIRQTTFAHVTTIQYMYIATVQYTVQKPYVSMQ